MEVQLHADGKLSTAVCISMGSLKGGKKKHHCVLTPSRLGVRFITLPAVCVDIFSVCEGIFPPGLCGIPLASSKNSPPPLCPLFPGSV